MFKIKRLKKLKAGAFPVEVTEVFDVDNNPLVIFLKNGIGKEDAEPVRNAVAKLPKGVGIILEIDSGGGHITSANGVASLLSVLTTRQVVGLVVGKCCSAALDIYLSLPKEYRFALPGTNFMFHSISSTLEFNGQIDLTKKTVDGLTLKEAKKVMAERLAYFYAEAMSHEADRNKRFARYIDQLRDIGSSKTRPKYMADNYHFCSATAKRIGVVGTIIDLVSDNWDDG